jgi:hypothetical protein
MQNELEEKRTKLLYLLTYPQELIGASPANIIRKDNDRDKGNALKDLSSMVNTSLQAQLKSASINYYIAKRFKLINLK